MTRPRRFQRGAAILPSLFTTGNLFFGFWAIVKTFEGRLEEAGAFIGVAILLDMLDGRIARLTGTTSEFGAQLDSLSDAISFGVAPAVLVYRWALEDLPRAWLAAFLFAVCGVMRLARFNVQRHVVDARYFVGLPIPAAAGQLATLVFFAPAVVADDRVRSLLVLALVVTLAFLMVSTFRYRSFKGIDLRRRRSYINVLGIALLFLLIAAQPSVTLLAGASFYTLSGPLLHLYGVVRRRREPPAAEVVEGTG